VGSHPETCAVDRAVLQSATERPGPLTQAHQPVSAGDAASARAWARPPTGVADLDVDSVLDVGHAHLRLRRPRMLQHVGQRLLHHAVGGQLGAGIERAAAAPDRQRDLDAGVVDVLDESAEVVDGVQGRACGVSVLLRNRPSIERVWVSALRLVSAMISSACSAAVTSVRMT
jgi:hypothetical protein